MKTFKGRVLNAGYYKGEAVVSLKGTEKKEHLVCHIRWELKGMRDHI